MGKVVLNVVLVLFLCAGFAQARQTQVVNQIATIKTVESDDPARFANPSEPGIPAGDLNNDGIIDYIQQTETWRDIRTPGSEFEVITTILSYDDDANTVKTSMLVGRYFVVGDIDNDGSAELAIKNGNGNIDIVSFTEEGEEPFVIDNGSTIEVDPAASYPGLQESLIGDLNGDTLLDALLCENTFASFENCMIIFGQSGTEDPFDFLEFGLDDFDIEFSFNPRRLVDRSLTGTGYSIYVFGDLPSFQGMMYEFKVNGEGVLELVFSYEWVPASGEAMNDRRYFIADIDGDDELEILSSDDRTFPLAGFTRFYFNTPVCDVRDIDYSGDSLVVQTPDIISNNCLIDRVIEFEVPEEPAKAVTNDAALGIWREGNYSSCSASDISNGCSNDTEVISDQTVLPCTYNSCRGPNYYDYYWNGVANPAISQRGLQRFIPQPDQSVVITPTQRSLLAEITRIAEIVCTQILSLFSGNTTQQLIELNYQTGFTTAADRYSCSYDSGGAAATCQSSNPYTYYYWDDYPAGQQSRGSASSVYNGDYYYYQYTYDDGDDQDYMYYYVYDDEEYEEDDDDLDDEEEEEKVRGKASLTSAIDDTLTSTGQFNLEVLGDFDPGFGSFVINNIGNVDGVPGEEILLGANFKTVGGVGVKTAWLYRGANTTFQEPDAVIDFQNDSTITEFSFLSPGTIAEPLGDVNGDGFNDFAVGLTSYNQTGNSSGAVYVFSGSNFAPAKAVSQDTLNTPMVVLEPNPLESQSVYTFGSQITGGDFDGDGYNDVAVIADFGSGTPTLPTVYVYKGGEQMDAEPDYLLHVTRDDVGGTGTDTLVSFFDAVIAFMPEEVGADHQDLYFSPGAFSGFPDAVIFTGGIDEASKQKGINSPATTPSLTLAEFGPTTTGTGVFLRKKPATGDLNGDGFYDIVVEKQYDSRDGAVSSRILIYSPNSGITVSTEEELENPLEYRLSQNYPNPFNPSTTIEFNLAKATDVSLTIYDILGREVAVLIDQEQYSSGLQRVQFDASSLASGVYLYRLEAGGFIQTRKMTLIK